MLFVGVINKDSNKTIWSKAIQSLAGISDYIKIVIKAEALSISAVNIARTSCGEIEFKKSFFYQYDVDFTNVIKDGFQLELDDGDGDHVASYSMIVNSKHLIALFKNIDAHDLEYICLQAHISTDTPSAVLYKILVEMRASNRILRKYQVNYEPVLQKKVDIFSQYKKELYDQNMSEQAGRGVQEGVKYIMVDQSIPRQFLDMMPSSTEEFGIEVNQEDMLLSGFTNQIVKDNEYIKQPMSVAVALSIDDLVHSNLHNLSGDSSVRINFRLKYFRNFMQLVSSINTKSATALETQDNITSHYELIENSEEYLELFFKNPGDPILFELKSNRHLVIQYIQVTNDGNSNRVEGSGKHSKHTSTQSSLKKRKESKNTNAFVLQPYAIQKRAAERQSLPKIINSHNGASHDLPPALTGVAQHASARSDADRPADQLFVPELESQTEEAASDSNANFDLTFSGDSRQDMITYGNDRNTGSIPFLKPGSDAEEIRKPHVRELRSRKINTYGSSETNKRIIIDEDTEYETGDSDDGGANQEELGPTQGPKRPRSILE